jgi:beta-lactamase superfamily II metal-dependent hydrolase
MEKPALELLVSRYKPNRMLDTEVYEAGHHGAENGTITSLLEAVTADLAIISVGHRGDSGAKTAYGYGHPRIEALELLEASIRAPRPAVQGFMATAKNNGTTIPNRKRSTRPDGMATSSSLPMPSDISQWA